MRQTAMLGLDVGGAHLKLARLAADGSCLLAREVACRLWEGLDRLDAALAEAGAAPGAGEPVAVTMTAELADLFPSRAVGVARILDRLEGALAPAPLLVFAGGEGFVPPARAKALPGRVASMNWLASAGLVAGRVPDALFVDVGSTTTDLVAIRGGTVHAVAATDAGRLGSGELVYTGLVRTPVMALAERAPFAGTWRTVMAERFATSADVWRLLGELDEGADLHASADEGPKTAEASARRLARCVGSDAEDAAMADWVRLARWFAERQLVRIEEAMALLLSREPVDEGAPVVAAGVGLPIARRLAARAGSIYLEAAALVPTEPSARAAVAACFPAVAVAVLALACSSTASRSA